MLAVGRLQWDEAVRSAGERFLLPGSILDDDKISSMVHSSGMVVLKFSAPSNPYRKANGMWAFDFFPDGVRTEFAQYPDEKSAQADAQVMSKRWAMDASYSFVSGIEFPLH